MIFNYQARDEQGVVKKGVVEAVTMEKAADILRDHGMIIVSLEPEEITIPIEKYIPFINRVGRKEMVLFSRQLSTLINAKVPIVQALNILQEQVTSQKLRQIMTDMVADIEGGKSLSESMEKHPDVFSNLYINLVKAGEISGTLDDSLLYLADQQEKDYDLISKVRGALTYPAFIVSAIIVVGGLMFVFVLPQMLDVLRQSGATLPLTTRILIFMTEFLQNYWWVVIGGTIGLITAFQIYVHSSGGRLVWDSAKLKIPIIGNVMQKIYLDRFARNLSTLIAGGIPIVQSLHTVADIVGNFYYKNLILSASKDVENGKTIAASLSGQEGVPALVTQMIKIGEQTGTLDEILEKLATFYDKEVENSIGTLTTLLEPAIMLLLGAAVAVMVAGVLLPIYNLASVA